MFSVGTTITLLVTAKILKPPKQKNLLTLGQAFIGMILVNMVGMRGTERAYRS